MGIIGFKAFLRLRSNRLGRVQMTNQTTKGNHVILVKNDKMGFGDDDLGQILIQGFINKIAEVSPLPDKIIFYNNGVSLTLKDSPVLDSLQALRNAGVQILICGTCVDFFNITENIGCGDISNMHDITVSLTNASHIITP